MLSKASFAERAGMTRGAITKSCRTILKDAVNGDRIDAAHPVAVAYLERPRTGKKPSVRGPVVAKEKRKPQIPSDPTESKLAVPEDIREFLDWTLGRVIEEFGTTQCFLDFLNAAQKLEMIHEKRLKNARVERELVNSQMVKECIIDVFEAAHMRLMTDGAKSIAAGAVSKHVSGGNAEEVERYVSDIISSHLQKLKINSMRALAEY